MGKRAKASAELRTYGHFFLPPHPYGIIAKGRTKNSGTKIIVTSPRPPRSGGAKGKDDDRFKPQAAALERLGARLQAITFSLHPDGS
jgi:hypothetical protein